MVLIAFFAVLFVAIFVARFRTSFVTVVTARKSKIHQLTKQIYRDYHVLKLGSTANG